MAVRIRRLELHLVYRQASARPSDPADVFPVFAGYALYRMVIYTGRAAPPVDNKPARRLKKAYLPLGFPLVVVGGLRRDLQPPPRRGPFAAALCHLFLE